MLVVKERLGDGSLRTPERALPDSMDVLHPAHCHPGCLTKPAAEVRKAGFTTPYDTLRNVELFAGHVRWLLDN